MALDVEEIKNAVPSQHKGKITAEFVADFNKLIDDPDYGEVYGRNIVSFTNVLSEGKFKLTDYFNAVAFVSHKMLGLTNLDAYGKVFPDKLKRLLNTYNDMKILHTYASEYNNNKLVTLVTQQTIMPDFIVYASIRHKAIRTQAELLNHKNPHVQQKAADSLLNHLKPPVEAKMSIDIGAKDTGVIADLANALSNLSNQQRGMIIDGSVDAKEIIHAPLMITKEVNDE